MLRKLVEHRFVWMIGLCFFACANVQAIPTVYPHGLTILMPGATNGYVLFAGPDGKLYLIDKESGNLVRRWVSPDPDRPEIGYARPLENGNILAFLTARPTPGCGNNCGNMVAELHQDGSIVWAYESPQGWFLHHDVQRLENGNTLILCSRSLDVPAISDLPIIDDCLLEVDVNGTSVFFWQTADHFSEFDWTPEQAQLIRERGGDYLHANSAEEIPSNTSHPEPEFAPGNIIISYRHANIIIIVDKTTGDIVWKNESTVGQHYAHMLSDDLEGGGNILVFDNGGGAGYPEVARTFSRVIEIDPATKEIEFEYRGRDSGRADWHFFSHFVSGAERLRNGHTFIDEGSTGRLFEVDLNGAIVWEWLNPFQGELFNGDEHFTIYRAHHVDRNWPILEE